MRMRNARMCTSTAAAAAGVPQAPIHRRRPRGHATIAWRALALAAAPEMLLISLSDYRTLRAAGAAAVFGPNYATASAQRAREQPAVRAPAVSAHERACARADTRSHSTVVARRGHSMCQVNELAQ